MSSTASGREQAFAIFPTYPFFFHVILQAVGSDYPRVEDSSHETCDDPDWARIAGMRGVGILRERSESIVQTLYVH